MLLIDGAAGLENLGRINFPDALQIVDFYHALEHLKTLLEALWSKDHPDIQKQRHRWAKLLLKDMLKQEAAFTDHIPRDYRPTPTPNPASGN